MFRLMGIVGALISLFFAQKFYNDKIATDYSEVDAVLVASKVSCYRDGKDTDYFDCNVILNGTSEKV